MQRALRIQGPDGTLAATVTGRSGPAMLLCNGLFCSTHYYDLLAAELSSDHRVITFDYRGHGASDDARAPTETTLDSLADDALAVLDDVAPDGAIVVGHSMGVRVALDVAARRPGRVSGAILMCGSVWGAAGDGHLVKRVEPLLGRTITTLGRGGVVTSKLRDLLLQPSLLLTLGSLLGGLSPSTPKGPVEALIENVRRLDLGLMSAIARSYLEHSARDALAAFDHPAMQLLGGRDRLVTSSHARAVTRLMRHGETHVLERCTHLAPIEEPQTVHRLVRKFSERVSKID